jgi:hypothetical protein
MLVSTRVGNVKGWRKQRELGEEEAVEIIIK